MKDFIFSNPQGTFRVEYKTDHMDGWDNFTVHDIIFKSDNYTMDDLIRFGLKFDRLPYTLVEFKQFAEDNNLDLQELDYNDTAPVALENATHLAITTVAIDAGMEGVPQNVTLTTPATAAATQGDYVILFNKTGQSFAIWFDIDAAGTVPNGPIFLATDFQIEVNIVTGGTNIVNAGLVKAAVEADLNWDGFETITDNGDGTLDILCTNAGECEDPVRHDEPETGNGSFSFVVGPDGSGDYSFQLTDEGGNGNITYSIESGTLDPGLTMSSTGLISGIPTTAATYTVMYKITDSYGQIATKELDLVISS